MSDRGAAPTVLFVVSEDWYFVSHRLPQARAVRDLGCRVVVAARMRAHEPAIRAEGFEPVAIPMVRGSLNPLRELRSVWALWRIIRAERPAVMHCVALKPILAGGLAALAVRRLKVVNAFTGMGSVLGHGVSGKRLLRTALKWIIRLLSRANRAHAIVQNEDDRAFLSRERIAPAGRVTLIAGSGVDTQAFAPDGEPDGPVTVLMVARLLRDKGVAELVSAAAMLRAEGDGVRVWIVGDRDPENPNSVTDAELGEWEGTGDVAFLGRREDVARLWQQAHIAALPSYGEGLPKSLLEAAACGRPIVTTDVTGCRDLVPDGRTGILVPPRDARALADALRRLAGNSGVRRQMGDAARELVLDRFSETEVGRATQGLYRMLLSGFSHGSQCR